MFKINPITAINQIRTKKQNSKNYPVQNFQSTDLGVLDNYKRDILYQRKIQDNIDSKKRLGKFIIKPHTKTTYSHEDCYSKNKATYQVLNQLPARLSWCAETIGRSATSIPWKMHLYANTEQDWQKLVATVGKYLNTQPVDWKTLNFNFPVDKLNKSPLQKGKVFTIYPCNQQQFKQLAHDIDYIVRLNKMEIADSNIRGDRKLGTSGRIFYRYEHQSGKTKDRIYNECDDFESAEYRSNYDSNRGADRYLAYDMTITDDPFYTFNPQEPVLF